MRISHLHWIVGLQRLWERRTTLTVSGERNVRKTHTSVHLSVCRLYFLSAHKDCICNRAGKMNPTEDNLLQLVLK